MGKVKVIENALILIIAVGIFFTATIGMHLAFQGISHITDLPSPSALTYTLSETAKYVLIHFIILKVCIKYIEKKDEVEKLQEQVFELENPEPRCSYSNELHSVGGSHEDELSKRDQAHLLSHLMSNEAIRGNLLKKVEGKLDLLLDEIFPTEATKQNFEVKTDPL